LEGKGTPNEVNLHCLSLIETINTISEIKITIFGACLFQTSAFVDIGGFRLIHNYFFTHVRIKKYEMTETEECPICDQLEMSGHLLW
jgi:hypothetical protein